MADPSPRDQMIGEYRLGRELGQGSIGKVLVAAHKDSGHEVAIKLFSPVISRNPEFAKRFPFDSRAISLIRHPNLVETVAFGMRPDRTCYAIMELLEGESLQSRLGNQGRMKESEALQIIHPIAKALSAIEELHHWNLKPANVMLVPDAGGFERVKLLDFGLARLSGVTTPPADAPPGSDAYLAPEQRAASATLGGKADVYSLGAMLHEMLCGWVPAPDSQEPMGSPVSPALAELVWKLMDENPAARLSMREAEVQIGRLARPVPGATSEEPLTSSSSPSLPAGEAPSNSTMAWAQVLADSRREEKAARRANDRPRGGLGARHLLLFAAVVLMIVGGFLALRHRSQRLQAHEAEVRREPAAAAPPKAAPPPAVSAPAATAAATATLVGRSPEEPAKEKGKTRGKRHR